MPGLTVELSNVFYRITLMVIGGCIQSYFHNPPSRHKKTGEKRFDAELAIWGMLGMSVLVVKADQNLFLFVLMESVECIKDIRRYNLGQKQRAG
ncbi:hypothetical protein M3226_29770 [Neobacillus cucumis]|uniref:hypothetical protein n=1 Tax=Neobacillus cucumis TaxID=1740721 RepID=UPI0020405560|nr:hypothetical protein [Neobacillus cucumis]MCM3729747.1 hypothetical protein [Neobacillus cucumis]